MKISNPRLLAGNVALATQNYVSGYVSSYVDDKLFNKDKIKASLLPDISITSVTPIKLDNILNNSDATNIQKAKDILLTYLSSQQIQIQQGDVIIVTTQSSDYNSELVGPWIVTSPTIENENQSLDITKLIFPTATVKSVNGFTPDLSGNITVPTVPISSYTEFVALSSQVDTNVTDIQTLSSYIDTNINNLNVNVSTLSGKVSNNTTTITGLTETVSTLSGEIETNIKNIDNISDQVNINKIDIQTLSGKLDNLESVSKLSTDLEYVSGIVDNNITNISANTENINDIKAVINKFNNHAFYVKSLTFSLNTGSTSVSPVPFGEAISVSISELTDNSTKQFGTDLKLYSTQITLPQNSEIIETYLVDNNISENFYPDILISGNMYTINILAGENELENKQLKIVYSNYNILVNE